MATVRINPVGVIRFRAAAVDQVERVTREVHGDARRGAAVDTGEMLSSIRWEMRGDDGYVLVSAPHWATVEYGSAPHVIESHGPWPLRNAETGEVFGRRVHHPGTPAQPFMRPALWQKRVLT
jgi:hypothetical protein